MTRGDQEQYLQEWAEKEEQYGPMMVAAMNRAVLMALMKVARHLQHAQAGLRIVTKAPPRTREMVVGLRYDKIEEVLEHTEKALQAVSISSYVYPGELELLRSEGIDPETGRPFPQEEPAAEAAQERDDLRHSP